MNYSASIHTMVYTVIISKEYLRSIYTQKVRHLTYITKKGKLKSNMYNLC